MDSIRLSMRNMTDHILRGGIAADHTCEKGGGHSLANHKRTFLAELEGGHGKKIHVALIATAKGNCSLSQIDGPLVFISLIPTSHCIKKQSFVILPI